MRLRHSVKDSIKNSIYILLLTTLVWCKPNTDKNTSTSEYTLAEQAMQKDFAVFQSIFETANAGLYKYRNKSQVDSIFIVNKKQITAYTSYRDFYNLIWNVIDYTGSCHNSLAYPDSLDQALNTQKVFFPLPLKVIDRELYTNIKHEAIPLGSEIITVNGIPKDEFLKRISSYISTDGFNTSGKHASVSTDWQAFYIYLALGKQNTFTIGYKDNRSETTKKVRLQSVSYDTFYKTYSKRFSKPYDTRHPQDYSYELLDSINTGLLTVKTFGMGGSDSNEHKAYAKFLDSVFTSIRDTKTKNLIVDIRGNGGGDDPNDLLLYSYLTQRNFRENTSAFTLFQDIPFTEYYVDDDIDELPLELKEEHSIYKNGKYYQNKTFNPIWQPNKNAFNGNLVLLVDPFVASAGSLFASLVKSDANSTVIGEETLGGYYGHTGHIPVTYELPNSKLLLTFSIVDLEQDVSILADQQKGGGIKPDIRVVQSYEDFRNHKDQPLSIALKTIKSLN